MATAYIRARGADRMSSYVILLLYLMNAMLRPQVFWAREVSDGVIAPSYSEEALNILKTKRKGTYVVIQMDTDYVPEEIELKDLYGVTFQQGRNNFKITDNVLSNIVTQNKELPEEAKRDLILSLITLKYTQSNSVCYAKDGQAHRYWSGSAIRVHCTRLAGNKAEYGICVRIPKFYRFHSVKI